MKHLCTHLSGRVAFKLSLVAGIAMVISVALAGERDGSKRAIHSLVFANAHGAAETIHARGAIDFSNTFFEPLGTNGRSCDSCHQPSDGWSVTPAHIQQRFDRTGGTDPIFRINDGANSPLADVSTVEARRVAYSLLLTKGLVRIGLPVLADAEFELTRILDPYAYASAEELSLYRRPLPSTNLSLLNTVMWDARETHVDAGSNVCVIGTAQCFARHTSNLAEQANGATVGHAQAASPLTDAQREAIVDFELGLFTAQAFDTNGRTLSSQGARGGVRQLAAQTFYFGINDFVYGDYRRSVAFDANAFSLFGAWTEPSISRGNDIEAIDARRSIARGEAIFNAKRFSIKAVAGFNDVVGAAEVIGTCSTCHNAPNSGGQSVPGTMDIGVSDISRRTPDMPAYVFKHKTSGETKATTDPGRGLVSGKWDDIGKFKVPSMRALAARPPYFHNGSASDLAAVVDFYDGRFEIGLDPVETADLVAFLRAL